MRARRLRGRLERGSADVGTDSGMGSDMMRSDLRRKKRRSEVVKLGRSGRSLSYVDLALAELGNMCMSDFTDIKFLVTC